MKKIVQLSSVTVSLSFIAKPVRASEQSCLTCHQTDSAAILARKPNETMQPLKIGDPLGVALYAYRESK